LSAPKAILTAMLRHPRVMVEAATLILVGLVWVGGPSIGLESVDLRVQIIFGLILLRFALFLIEQYLAKRRAEKLEQSLGQQARDHYASARPDRKEELDDVRKQFEKGVASLKASKLGRGIKGKAALFALPWYMFIGPPASGKSTALRHSGLQFPYLGGAGQGLQGIGGTRNCDWWFTNDAVLLDTAGRYVTQDEDQDEWLAFLTLLKKYRPGKPINGVLAAISIADLFQGSEEEVEGHAKKIRNRIDELIKHLGIVFPVYVVFTKCDLLQGFVEFFEDLSRSEREHVWGGTFAKSDTAKTEPQTAFRSELDGLIAAVEARRLARMARARGTHKINIFGFPLQLASGRDKLTRFIEALFQMNPYQENPLFRGFYFTSGTQEGTPIDRILGAVSRASGLSEAMVSSFVESEPKSYFLKDLFTDVIFPDHVLVTPSSAVHRQRGYLRAGVFAVSVLLAVLGVAGLAVSFVGNKRLVGATLSAALTAPETGLIDEASTEKTMEFMDALGTRFEQVYGYEHGGVPFHLWGLYRGDTVYEPLRDLYAKQFHRIFLGATKREMEERLAQFIAGGSEGGKEQGDYYYSILKAYLMLGEPHHLNPSYLERWLSDLTRERLQAVYGGGAVPKWVDEAMVRQMNSYSHHLAKEEGHRLVLHRRLAHEVQQRLKDVPIVERVYSLARREATVAVKPFTLDNAAQVGYQGTLVSDYAIPGVFTYEGWRGPFQTTLKKALDESGEEGWVIGEPEVRRTDLEQNVKRLYYKDYVRYWKGFLRSLRIRPTVTPVNTEDVIAALSQAESPLLRVFETVDRNTVPGPEGMGRIQDAAHGILESVKKKLGMESTDTPSPFSVVLKDGATAEFSTNVSDQFQSIHSLLVVPKDAKEAPLGLYLSELRKVNQALRPMLLAEVATPDTKAIAKNIVAGEPNDLLQGFKTTDGLLQTLDADSREAVLALFFEPWIMAMRGVVDRVKTDVARRWETEVHPPCQRNIESRYPFRRSGEDAALADVVEFFHPQNGVLWKFYQVELKPFIQEGADHWDPRTWNGVGMRLSPEFLDALARARFLSEGLFPKGASDLGNVFELYPYPPQGGAGRTVTEIRLELGGQLLRYRMEPQEWHELKWPGTSAAAGSILQVQIGNAWITKEYKDWWGFFRLLNAAQVVPASGGSQFRVQWDLETPDARTLHIQYDLKASSYKNPFHPGVFEQFRCVSQL
jgi:type VI secretion system protein ImpL